MASQKGRDLLLKIGDGGEVEVFTTIGAARIASVNINNNPVDVTAMNSRGLQALQADAGIQTLEIYLDGLFKDAVAEEMLRASAFNRSLKNYELIFPNGNKITGAFVVTSYKRDGAYDGLESFSVRLLRSGASSFVGSV